MRDHDSNVAELQRRQEGSRAGQRRDRALDDPLVTVHLDGANVLAGRSREHAGIEPVRFAVASVAPDHQLEKAVTGSHVRADRELSQPLLEQRAPAPDELGARSMLVHVEIDRDQLAARIVHRLQGIGVDREQLAVERCSERGLELVDAHGLALPLYNGRA
jgi:hypothetical protein